MKKNSGDILESVGIDPITGKYYIIIPEQIINDLEWYEDAKIKLSVEGNEVILKEVD